MEPEKVRAYLKGREEMAVARECKGLEEKLNSWRESLAPLTAMILTSGSRPAHGPTGSNLRMMAHIIMNDCCIILLYTTLNAVLWEEA